MILVTFGCILIAGGAFGLGHFAGRTLANIEIRSADEKAEHWYSQFDAEREKRAALENRVRSLSLKLRQLADCDGNYTELNK